MARRKKAPSIVPKMKPMTPKPAKVLTGPMRTLMMRGRNPAMERMMQIRAGVRPMRAGMRLAAVKRV